MKVAIIGHGVEGKSAERYWQAQGADVSVHDQQDGDEYLDDLDQFDLIVRSPGIHPGLLKTSKPVTSVTAEFFAKCPVPIIGVTGTKGKGTTATLIAKMLEAGGHKVWLGGNIGTAPLDFLDQIKAGDKVVLELSSFQLMDLDQSPQTAVMLMIGEDHLNYHADMAEYTEAKANIFRYQKEGDRAVYNAADPITTKLVEYSKADKIPYLVIPDRKRAQTVPDESASSPESLNKVQAAGGCWVEGGQIMMAGTSICATNEVGLIGEHNLQNVCAAVAAVWDEVKDAAQLAQAIKEFKGLPHRLQIVGKVNGVTYVDDSYAVNPSATAAALKVFAGPKVIIVGGFDRGIDMAPLAAAVKQSNVRRAVVIGQTADRIVKEFEAAGFSDYETGAASMAEAIKTAVAATETGDTVLLAPGCPSFDMFKNFEDRGDQFQAAVKGLS